MKKLLCSLACLVLISAGAFGQILFDNNPDDVIDNNNKYEYKGMNAKKFSMAYYEFGNFISYNFLSGKNTGLRFGRSFAAGASTKIDIGKSSLVVTNAYYRRQQNLRTETTVNPFAPDSLWQKEKWASNGYSLGLHLRNYYLRKGNSLNGFVDVGVEAIYFFADRFAAKKTDGNIRYRYTENDYKNLNRFVLVPTLRIGFNNLAVGARYYLQEAYKDGKFKQENFGNFNVFLTIYLPN